jgi:hypothetical protein
MRCRTIVALGALGLTGWIGCASEPPEPEVDYSLPSGVAAGDDVMVAMVRRTAPAHEEIVTVRVHAGQPTPPVVAVSGFYADKLVGEPLLAAVDGHAYLSFFGDHGYHGAPLGSDDAIDAGALVDLGFRPALVRLGDRFASVSYPDHGFVVLSPSDTFHASFVTADGHADGAVDVATLATPLGTLGLPPRCAGNSKLLALVYERTSLFSPTSVLVSRLDATGAHLGVDSELAPDHDDQTSVGDAQLTVTGDSATLVVYAFVVHGQTSMRVARIEPGPSGGVSDLVSDLPGVPALLTTSGDRVLAISAPGPTGAENFTNITVRILDDHGRTVAGPTQIATGYPGATALATPDGFAVLSFDESDVVMTPIGRDGTPGTPVMVGESHHAASEADSGGCSTGRVPGPALLLLVLAVGWRARSGRRTLCRV